jgi:glycosyltransferase involved in cell wall biosynthesis
MKPKVTIGICVRNCESTVREAIESIIDQDYPRELLEVIVVDGYSNDKTVQILKEVLSHSNIKNYFFFENKGLGFAREIVVENANGEFIIWVDGDMILPKDFVRKQVEFMEQNPKVGIGKGRYGLLNEGSIVAFLENIAYVASDLKNNSSEPKLPGTGGAIFRVDAIRKAGGFDERLKGVGEDQDLAYRIKTAGWHIKRTPAVFYERRVKSWKGLWRKYFWYGYGNYQLYQKNKNIFSLFHMNPITSFLAGLLYIKYAYEWTYSKHVFLLPFHNMLKQIFWFLGFLEAQFALVNLYSKDGK